MVSNAAPNTDDLEGDLLAQAHSAIRAMLAKKKPAEEITLTEIERLVGAMGEAWLPVATQVLVNDAQQGPKAAARCPECAEAMHYKGRKAKPVVTVRGEVVVERAYDYCARCGRGFFPSGCAVGVE